MALNLRKYVSTLWQNLPFGKERDAFQELDRHIQALAKDVAALSFAPSLFSVYLNTTPPASTNQKVSFDKVVFDALGEFSGGTFRPQAAGTYVFTGSAWFNSVTVGNYLSVYLKVTSGGATTTVTLAFQAPGRAGGAQVTGMSPPIKLAAGDVVEMWVNSSAAYSLATGQDSTWFGGHRIA
jgi:hypothetical protein